MEYLIFCIASVFYLTAVLSVDDFGFGMGIPLPFLTLVAYDKDSRSFYKQPMRVFDLLRIPFFAYRFTGTREVFIIKERMNFWRCPYCLSFWVALVFSVLYLAENTQLTVLNVTLYTFGLAGCSVLLHRFKR